MEEIFEIILIDLDRIPILIGKNGEVKKNLEEKFKCSIEINSKTGEIKVSGFDGGEIFNLKNIIEAINLGHNPKDALKIFDENFVLDYIDVNSKVRDSKRLKIVIGRIIGKNGSTRKLIEDLTKCSISVKDHFVSFIGPYENTHLIHRALEMLINGSSHKTFYNFLEKNREKMDLGQI